MTIETIKKSNLFSADSKPLQTKQPTFIPLIDFESKSFSQDLVKALQQVGFVYVKNHGIPQEQVNRMFQYSKVFFDKDPSYKLKLIWETAESNRGYVPMGMEKLSELDKQNRSDDIKQLRKVNPDVKESFEVGKEDPEFPNKFPTDWPEFADECKSFFKTLHELNVKLMNSIGQGLGLGNSYFDKLVNKSDNTLRLLHYQSTEKSKLDDDLSRRAGAHCDYGSITLLFQDQTGGLEVHDCHSDEFVKAVPIDGTILVNIGDQMQRWSNDILKSTLHRVVKPYQADSDCYPARYSIAYFCNPNFDCQIDCLPTCYSAENPPKYEPVNSFDYLVGRLNNTYM